MWMILLIKLAVERGDCGLIVFQGKFGKVLGNEKESDRRISMRPSTPNAISSKIWNIYEMYPLPQPPLFFCSWTMLMIVLDHPIVQNGYYTSCPPR
jgi:hypothetical protein